MRSNKIVTLISFACFAVAVTFTILYMWKNKFTLAETGTLGDGFNGLLAPFISFTGALLVYLSFRAQIRANVIITSQWQYDLLIRLVDDLVRNYENVKVSRTTTGIGKSNSELTMERETRDYRGEEFFSGLKRHKWDSFDNLENALTDLNTVLWEFLFIIQRIETAKLEDKDYLLLRSSVFYTRKIEIQITFLRDKIVNEYKEKYYSSNLVQIIDKLNAKAFQLRTKGTWGGLVK